MLIKIEKPDCGNDDLTWRVRGGRCQCGKDLGKGGPQYVDYDHNNMINNLGEGGPQRGDKQLDPCTHFDNQSNEDDADIHCSYAPST